MLRQTRGLPTEVLFYSTFVVLLNFFLDFLWTQKFLKTVTMDEEVMWKTLYEKIESERAAVNVETEHEVRYGVIPTFIYFYLFIETKGSYLGQRALCTNQKVLKLK